MRLSLAELKKQSEGIVLGEVLQTIQGGSENDCHVNPTDDSLTEGLQEIDLPPSGNWIWNNP
jgi:hypothetical protein